MKNKVKLSQSHSTHHERVHVLDISQHNSLYFKILVVVALLLGMLFGFSVYHHKRVTTIQSFHATPFNIVHPLARIDARPKSLVSPTGIKSAYHLTSSLTAGSGSTIAIVDAYNDPNIQNDLNVFNNEYSLPSCTTANGCFSIVKMRSYEPTSSDWAIEDSLDVEWAHAVAPGAKIIFIEAASSNGIDLLNAINYARSIPTVSAISMSWGGNEFPTEGMYESDFTSKYGATFFAASGDNGHGTSWPAVSAGVIGVGGTSANVSSTGSLLSEVAWSGSGGGLSSYITEPAWQKSYNVPAALGFRASPDVAYNADPNDGYPVFDSVPYYGSAGWWEVGGTSAGTPQWAAIRAIDGPSLTAQKLYSDAITVPSDFNDIISGSNGTCGFYCNTAVGYDYVTGLGTPATTKY